VGGRSKGDVTGLPRGIPEGGKEKVKNPLSCGSNFNAGRKGGSTRPSKRDVYPHLLKKKLTKEEEFTGGKEGETWVGSRERGEGKSISRMQLNVGLNTKNRKKSDAPHNRDLRLEGEAANQRRRLSHKEKDIEIGTPSVQ